ncbi:DUF1254 domain-containing protein [Sphingomonas sp.]|uniref:DUF1254 domain-containing protein n=1 Tax=Sphingomonas sp. TaxID=28214 RepID=UPI003CC5674B
MRRWLLPLLVGLGVTFVTFHLALVATPRVLMAAAIKRVGRAGMNRMTAGPLATDKARAIVRPSPDLAYSSCPFDLSAGPIRVQTPALPSSYWSLSVFDARTDVVYVRNNREVGGREIDVFLARPGQVTPPGATVVRVDGARGIALIRILVQDRARFAVIDTARRGASCGPA